MLVYDVLPVPVWQPRAEQEDEQLVGSRERAAKRFRLEEADNLFSRTFEGLPVRRVGFELLAMHSQADPGSLDCRADVAGLGVSVQEPAFRILGFLVGRLAEDLRPASVRCPQITHRANDIAGPWSNESNTRHTF